jgi:NADH-quinone oxidoreductase subunit N
MLYLAVEMVSLPSYAIAGYKPGDRRAPEASLKYVIYRGVASGIMLFGLSYIYGPTGSTSLSALGVRLDNLAMPASAGGQAGLRVAVMVAVIFVLCGIGYPTYRPTSSSARPCASCTGGCGERSSGTWVSSSSS